METVGAIRFALLGALALALWTVPAHAATFAPTRFDDPTPNGCKPANCSLREAIIASNKHDGRDAIPLARGRYELEIPPTTDDTGSLDVRDGVDLFGAGPKRTKIDGNAIDGAMVVGADNELNDRFVIRDLGVTGGDASQFGGGIDAVSFEGDRLELSHVAIKHNAAAHGGGIHADISKLTIRDSTIADNEASSFGGGMRAGSSSTPASSKVKIFNSTIRGNEAPFGGGIYAFFPRMVVKNTTIDNNAANEGGGMDIVGQIATPHTTVRSSTISRNSATKGAGILADGDQPGASFAEPVVLLVNSTVALNLASAEGGGVLGDNAATVTLDNATIAHNTADVDNTGGGTGGGVNQHSGAVFGFGDSIVGANTVGTSGTGPQCQGAFSTDADGLVIQSQSSGTCSYGGIYTIAADPLIGSLAPNGGPTETVELLTGSPALGFAGSCPAVDQRGVKRPAEDCDSGAYERKGP